MNSLKKLSVSKVIARNTFSICLSLSLSLSLFLAVPSFVQAQFGGSAGSFLKIGFTPRALSMSNAVSSVPELSTNGFYNAALSAGTLNKDVEFGSSILSFDRSLHTVSLAFHLPPSAGIALQFMNAGVSNIDGRTLSGYPTDKITTNDYFIQTSFGVRAKPNFWIGTALKFVLSNYHPDVPTSTAFGIDIGFLIKINEKINISFAVNNLLLSHQWNSSDYYGGLEQSDQFNYFPTNYILGTSYRAMNNKMIISTDFVVSSLQSTIVQRSISNEFNPPTETTERVKRTSSTTGVNLGVSYLIHPRFRLSGGYSNQDLKVITDQHTFSSGFSLYLPFDKFAPAIEYALNREPNVGTFINTFSIRFSF
ncbi:MAG: hypothetical protein GW823_02980 [Bacteroidetes bacterium]|nr:hypothetical protein [Bacteroidota bacterium]